VARLLERFATELERVKNPKFLAGKARMICETLELLPQVQSAALLSYHATPGTHEARLNAYNKALGRTVTMNTLYRHVARAEDAFVAALPFDPKAAVPAE
jgi:hypothetical protein